MKDYAVTRNEVRSRFITIPELPLQPPLELPYMDAYGRTEPGCDRALNDDQYLIADLDRRMLIRQSSFPAGTQPNWRTSSQGKLLAVADGIAGPGASCEAASRAIMDAVVQYITTTLPWIHTVIEEQDKARVLDDLKFVLSRCMQRLRRLGDKQGFEEPLASTLTLAYVVWPNLFVVHAGDSRCYLFRAGRLYQLTSDYTAAQGLVDHESREGGQAERAGLANVLNNVIGNPHKTRAEVHHVSLQDRDRILLCTDGMTRHLDNAEIAAHLNSEALSSAVCDRLINAARKAGSTESITTVACRFA